MKRPEYPPVTIIETKAVYPSLPAIVEFLLIAWEEFESWVDGIPFEAES